MLPVWYARHHYLLEVMRHAVRLYLRFMLDLGRPIYARIA